VPHLHLLCCAGSDSDNKQQQGRKKRWNVANSQGIFSFNGKTARNSYYSKLKKMQFLKPFIETKVGKKEVKDDSASLTGRIFMSKKKNPVPTNFSFLENFFGIFSI